MATDASPIVQDSVLHLRSSRWPSILEGLTAAGGILWLFYRWFAVADRYHVFLYYHDMGPRYPDTSAFSAVTGGRYWMAGLVAAGAVLLANTSFWLIAGRLHLRVVPPPCRRAWAVAALPLAIGIPLITMTANTPTLPLLHAGRATLAALLGLSLALLPGRLAAHSPGELILLGMDGAGLALLGLLALAIERSAPWVLALIVLGGGMGSLALSSGLRLWRHLPPPNGTALVAAGGIVSYPLMAIAHHVVGTDGRFYISDSDNFSLRDPVAQLCT